jgi:hypothetical protein
MIMRVKRREENIAKLYLLTKKYHPRNNTRVAL